MALFSFTYPITRPYPYKWFSWVVLVGGTCAFVFFSMLNFSANGYVLAVKYTTYPNQTIAEKTWTQSFSLNEKTVSSCEPQNLQVNTQYYTDKLSLVYTLSNIWQVQDNGRIQTLPSLPYTYNPLVNCTVAMIQLELNSEDGRTAAQLGWTPWGVNAVGMATCLVINNNGPTWLNLTVTYNFVPPTIESGLPFQFQQVPDNQTQASMWWAESLLSWYWLNLQYAMNLHTSYDNGKGTIDIIKGSFALRPSTNVTDITSLDFFLNPGFHFVSQEYDENGDAFGGPACCIHVPNNPTTIGALHDEGVQPDTWIEADSFSKIFCSSILSDLGQNSTSNIFTNSALLTTFSKNISSMVGTVETPWLKAGPARVPYSGDSSGSLSVNSSVLYTQYLCQVPVLKSTGSLIISILIADLVFLHTAWSLLNWITATRLKGGNPAANECDGCGGQDRGAVELIQTPGSYNQLANEESGLHKRHLSNSSAVL